MLVPLVLVVPQTGPGHPGAPGCAYAQSRRGPSRWSSKRLGGPLPCRSTARSGGARSSPGPPHPTQYANPRTSAPRGSVDVAMALLVLASPLAVTMALPGEYLGCWGARGEDRLRNAART